MAEGGADRVAMTGQSTLARDGSHPRTGLDVLVLDAVQRQSLVAVQSLGRLGLAVGAFDATHTAAGFSRWCTVRGKLPDPAHDSFGDALDEVLDRYRPRVVIPAHDGTIEVLRARRAELERRTRLALADEPALETAVDKRLTLEVARSLGIGVPRGVDVRDEDDVRTAVTEIGLPLVAKPARSWVTSAAGARRLAGGLAGTFDEAMRLVAGMREAGAAVLLQELVPGSRESVITCYADGRFAASVALCVRRTYPPLGGSSVIRESLPPSPELVEPSHRLVRAVGLEGVSEVEFRRDARGRLVLMEINPRLPATVELAVRAGVDVPQLLYRWALGQPLPAADPYRNGLRLRWLGGDLRWLVDTLRAQGQPGIAPALSATAAFLGDFARPSAYDYLRWDDLRPAAFAVGALVTRGIGGVIGRR